MPHGHSGPEKTGPICVFQECLTLLRWSFDERRPIARPLSLRTRQPLARADWLAVGAVWREPFSDAVPRNRENSREFARMEPRPGLLKP
jgi:hypothetical protein